MAVDSAWDVQIVSAANLSVLAFVPRFESLEFSNRMDDVGFGTLRIDFDEPFLDTFYTNNSNRYPWEGNYAVRVLRDGTAVMTFIIEESEVQYSGDRRLVTMAGRGLAATLEWGVVLPGRWDEALGNPGANVDTIYNSVNRAFGMTYDGGTDIAEINAADIDDPDYPAFGGAAFVLLFKEADTGVNQPLEAAHAHGWYASADRNGDAVDWPLSLHSNLSVTTDSKGTAWNASATYPDAEVNWLFEIPSGITMLDALKQLTEITANAQWMVSPTGVISIAKTIGLDKTGTILLTLPNAITSTRQFRRNDLRTFMVGSNGTVFDLQSDSTQAAIFGRREGFVGHSNPEGISNTAAAQQALDDVKNPLDEFIFQYIETATTRAWLDFDVADTVRIEYEPGVYQNRQVVGLSARLQGGTAVTEVAIGDVVMGAIGRLTTKGSTGQFSETINTLDYKAGRIPDPPKSVQTSAKNEGPFSQGVEVSWTAPAGWETHIDHYEVEVTPTGKKSDGSTNYPVDAVTSTAYTLESTLLETTGVSVLVTGLGRPSGEYEPKVRTVTKDGKKSQYASGSKFSLLAAAITVVDGHLASPNYSAGSAGWVIKSNGDAEFNDGTFRGDLEAGTISIGTDSTHVFKVNQYGDFWSGNTTETDAPFRVDNTGLLLAGTQVTGKTRLRIKPSSSQFLFDGTAIEFVATDTAASSAAHGFLQGGDFAIEDWPVAGTDFDVEGLVLGASENYVGAFRDHGGDYGVVLNATKSGESVVAINAEEGIKILHDGAPSSADYKLYRSGSTLYWHGAAVGGGSSDHGGLTGLTDDDHTQYVLVDGTRAMTGDLVVDTDTLFVDVSTDRVGINTASPSRGLDVFEAIRSGNHSTAGFLAGSRDGSGSDAWLYNPTGDDLRLYTGNADRLTILASSGNVGIGTATPSYKLDVTGTMRVTGNATITGTLTAGSISGTIDADTVDGEHASAFADAVHNHHGIYLRLDVIDAQTVQGNVTLDHLYNPLNDTYDIGSTSVRWRDIYVGEVKNVDAITAPTSTGLGLRVNNSSSDSVTITSAGDVGIGDTSPGYKLDVAGTGRFTSDLYCNNIFTVSNEIRLGNGSATDPSYTFIGDEDTGFYWRTANSIGVTCGTTVAGYFSNAGWVGGVTGTLTGNATGTAATVTTAAQPAITSVASTLGIGTTTTGTRQALAVVGNCIGIGTASFTCDASLHIDSVYGGNGRLTQMTGGAGTALNIIQGGSQWWAWGVGAGGKWYLNTGTTLASPIQFVIDTSGNVGIGDATPSYKLEVNGTLGVTGATTLLGHLQLNDSVEAQFGNSDDLKIYHDASNSYVVHNGIGDLYVKAAASGEDLYLQARDNVFIGTSASYTTRMTINDAGNVTMTGTLGVTGAVQGLTVRSTGGGDGGMILRSWTGNGAYASLATNGMTAGEYVLLSNGNDTFLGSGSGSTTHIRGPANSSTAQLAVGASTSQFNGNVGIGTTATSYTLDVSGTGRFSSDLTVAGEVRVSSGSDTNPSITFSSALTYGLGYVGSQYLNYAALIGNSVWHWAATSAGPFANLAVQTTASYVNYNGGKIGIASSRGVLKEGVTSIAVADALTRIKALRPVEFHFKQAAIDDGTNEMVGYNTHRGFIAEEVAAVDHWMAIHGWVDPTDELKQVNILDTESGVELDDAVPVDYSDRSIVADLVSVIQQMNTRLEALESA